MCVPDCAYTENMCICSIHISLYDISITQNILYQIKRDVAIWKRLGFPQRNQRTWWQHHIRAGVISWEVFHVWKREIGRKLKWNRDLQFLSWSRNVLFLHLKLCKRNAIFNREIVLLTLCFCDLFLAASIWNIWNIWYWIVKSAILWHENMNGVPIFSPPGRTYPFPDVIRKLPVFQTGQHHIPISHCLHPNYVTDNENPRLRVCFVAISHGVHSLHFLNISNTRFSSETWMNETVLWYSPSLRIANSGQTRKMDIHFFSILDYRADIFLF